MNNDLEKLTSIIQRDFGHDNARMFGLLLLLPMIDKKAWKFEDYMHESEVKDLVEYIENSEELRNVFGMKENYDDANEGERIP